MSSINGSAPAWFKIKALLKEFASDEIESLKAEYDKFVAENEDAFVFPEL